MLGLAFTLCTTSNTTRYIHKVHLLEYSRFPVNIVFGVSFESLWLCMYGWLVGYLACSFLFWEIGSATPGQSQLSALHCSPFLYSHVARSPSISFRNQQECQKIFKAVDTIDRASITQKLLGFGVGSIENIDPNPDNFVSAAIIHTRSAQIGCLLRLEPNSKAEVILHMYILSHLVNYNTMCKCWITWRYWICQGAFSVYIAKSWWQIID